MSYMFCESKAEAEELVDLAVKRIPAILEEFGRFFPNNNRVGITVKKQRNLLMWSVPAALTFDNEVVREYEGFDLLELDLLNMELSAIQLSGKTG